MTFAFVAKRRDCSICGQFCPVYYCIATAVQYMTLSFRSRSLHLFLQKLREETFNEIKECPLQIFWRDKRKEQALGEGGNNAVRAQKVRPRGKKKTRR